MLLLFSHRRLLALFEDFERFGRDFFLVVLIDLEAFAEVNKSHWSSTSLKLLPGEPA
jgi:hypothetical protein